MSLPKLTKTMTWAAILKYKNTGTDLKSYTIQWNDSIRGIPVFEYGFRTRAQAQQRINDVMSGLIEPVAFDWKDEETSLSPAAGKTDSMLE